MEITENTILQVMKYVITTHNDDWFKNVNALAKVIDWRLRHDDHIDGIENAIRIDTLNGDFTGKWAEERTEYLEEMKLFYSKELKAIMDNIGEGM